MSIKAHRFNAATPLGDTQTPDSLPPPSFRSSPLLPPSSNTSSVASFTSSSALSSYTRHLRAEREAREMESIVSMNMVPITMEIVQRSRQQSLLEEGEEENVWNRQQCFSSQDIIEDHSESFNASLDEALAYRRLRAEKEQEMYEMKADEKEEREIVTRKLVQPLPCFEDTSDTSSLVVSTSSNSVTSESTDETGEHHPESSGGAVKPNEVKKQEHQHHHHHHHHRSHHGLPSGRKDKSAGFTANSHSSDERILRTPKSKYSSKCQTPVPGTPLYNNNYEGPHTDSGDSDSSNTNVRNLSIHLAMFHQRRAHSTPQTPNHTSTFMRDSSFSQTVFKTEQDARAYKRFAEFDNASMVMPVICTTVLCVFLISLFCMW